MIHISLNNSYDNHVINSIYDILIINNMYNIHAVKQYLRHPYL